MVPGVAGAYSQTETVGSTLGARLVLAGVNAREVSLLVTRTPRSGRVRVRLGDVVLGTYSLRSPVKQTMRVIRVAQFPTIHSGTLSIRVVSATGKRVRIDGVIVTGG